MGAGLYSALNGGAMCTSCRRKRGAVSRPRIISVQFVLEANEHSVVKIASHPGGGIAPPLNSDLGTR